MPVNDKKKKKDIEVARVKKVLVNKNQKTKSGGPGFHNLSRSQQVEKLKKVKATQMSKRRLAKARFKRKARTPK